MKEALCRAFCDALSVREVPVGLAVRTPFVGSDGDPIGFFVVKSDGVAVRIEDNGLVLPVLEASGFDRRSPTRSTALRALANEYGVELDEDSRRFTLALADEESLPASALRFVAFSLRVRDLALLTERRVATTFRDDVVRLLKEAVGDRAEITENTPINESLADFIPDFVLRAPNRPPVGVFLGTSDARVLEAVVLQMRLLLRETKVDCSIVALLEREKSISTRVRQQAGNRLSHVGWFRGDEIAAIERVAREAIGIAPTVH